MQDYLFDLIKSCLNLEISNPLEISGNTILIKFENGTVFKITESIF